MKQYSPFGFKWKSNKFISRRLIDYKDLICRLGREIVSIWNGFAARIFLFIVCWCVKLVTSWQWATRNEKVDSVFKCLDCGSNKLNLKMPHGIFQSPFTFAPFSKYFKNSDSCSCTCVYSVILVLPLWLSGVFIRISYVWIYFETIFYAPSAIQTEEPSTHVLIHCNRNSTDLIKFHFIQNSFGNVKKTTA